MNDCLLYVGTEDGVSAYELRDGEATEVGAGLRGNAVREIDVHPANPRDALVACGLRGWGVHRTRDAGDSWTTVGFEDEWAWGVTRDPTDPDTVYVGTEPPMLYRSTDDADTFSAFDAIADLPSSDRWTFFYEPFEAGHVHGVAVDPENPEHVFAGVEHGGFVYTRDGGETWADALAGYDVHDAAVVPGTDRVFAAAGEGLLASDDGGESFGRVAGFEGHYVKQFCWAGDRLHVDSNPSSSSERSDVRYTDDGGDTWQSVGNVPDANVVGDRLLSAVGDTLFHARDGEDGGRVVATDDDGETWHEVGPVHDNVRVVAAAPLP